MKTSFFEAVSTEEATSGVPAVYVPAALLLIGINLSVAVTT